MTDTKPSEHQVCLFITLSFIHRTDAADVYEHDKYTHR